MKRLVLWPMTIASWLIAQLEAAPLRAQVHATLRVADKVAELTEALKARSARWGRREGSIMGRWRLCRQDGGGWSPMEGQPSDGFSGPGRAWRWLGERGQAELFGVELFVIRDDGARPSTGQRQKQYVTDRAA